jgi:hypothetical protein
MVISHQRGAGWKDTEEVSRGFGGKNRITRAREGKQKKRKPPRFALMVGLFVEEIILLLCRGLDKS